MQRSRSSGGGALRPSRARAILLVLAAGLALAGEARAAHPAGPFLSPALTGRSVPAANLAFTAGAGRYSFASGTAWEVADGAGRPLGIWIRGKGSLEWSTDDAAAMKVYRENAHRVGGLGAKKDGPIVAKVSSALVLFSPASRPEALPEPRTGSVAPPPPAELDAFLERWKYDTLPPPAAGLSAASVDGRKYFLSLIVAGKDVRHEVDETRGDCDTLTVVERPEGLPLSAGPFRFRRVVGTQPIGRSRREPPRADWLLTGLSVDVRETEEPRGLLGAEETIVAQRPLSTLTFDLSGLSLSPYRLARRETSLEEVALGDGTTLPSFYGGGTVVVFLPKPLAAGEAVTLRFRYDAPFFERHGDNSWELPLARAWYPRPPDVMARARHGMKAVVRAKKPLVPIAPGKTLRRFEDGEWNAVETVLEQEAPIHAILAGKYSFFEETRGGVTVRVASYGLSKPKSAARLLSLFQQLRGLYEGTFGPFPFVEYTIVDDNAHRAQGPPGLALLPHEAFEAAWSPFDESRLSERIAHEIAHAYWGGVVWNAQPADVWLVEAFAEVAAGRALEVLRDPREYERLRGVWRANAKLSASTAPMPFAAELVAKASPGAASTLRRDAGNLTHAKGPTLLVAIRAEVGDALFFGSMRALLESFASRRPAVVTDDFVGLLEYVTKRDWKPWFERYFYGTEVP
ncbi:MAG: M1 family aminopeptidase [Thermoanaerobaculia bacterium]